MSSESKDVTQKNSNIPKILDSIGKIKINKNNIIETLHTVMQAVETLEEGLTGSDKKSLALDVLSYIVDFQVEITDEDKFLLKTIISQIAPQAIDIIIKVSNGISDLVSKSISKCPCF
jgi:hypothetical protein